jgi:hypothetical protein
LKAFFGFFGEAEFIDVGSEDLGFAVAVYAGVDTHGGG